MFIKNVRILLALAALPAALGLNAQVTSGGYNWRDSAAIPPSRAAQQNEFKNNQYDYPAKPRNMWELGVKLGEFHINGDVSPVPNFGFGAHVRKSLGYTVSLRAEYMHGTGVGLNWKPSGNFRNNTAWTSTGYIPNRIDNSGNVLPGGQLVYYNYKSNVNDFALQALFSLNNIVFHKAASKTNVYLLAGAGLTWYKTNVNALNGTTRYNFSNVSGTVAYSDRANVRKALRDILDDSYETPAESYGATSSRIFGDFTARAHASVGFGFSYKISPRVNISLEERITFIQDDLIDGQRWAAQVVGLPVMTPQNDTYNHLSAGVNFNLGKQGKRTEPLYWLNPLNYAYSELNSPKHMKLPKPVLDDTDGDGVTDQFDREASTPKGCPVDAHGVSRDTDGDGVPDCKDKQLITPTECQPVNADGIGKCPDPKCCSDIKPPVDPCANVGGPSILFKKNSAAISRDAELALTFLAGSVRNSPTCRIVVTGYGEPSKSGQQLSWDRVNNIIRFLVERQAISESRFIFRHGQTGGDANTVDIRIATKDESGPNTVPAPHPNLSRKN